MTSWQHRKSPMNDHATRRPVILASALYVGQARHMSPPSKKIRGCEKYLRPDLTEESIISLIKSSWFDSSKDDCELKSSIKVIKHPFRVCVIDNVISSTELLKSTVNELKNVQFKDKSNDLYQFRQSDDLSNLREFKSTQYLYDCIRNEARAWICRILGDIDLKESVSATFSSYSYKGWSDYMNNVSMGNGKSKNNYFKKN